MVIHDQLSIPLRIRGDYNVRDVELLVEIFQFLCGFERRRVWGRMSWRRQTFNSFADSRGRVIPLLRRELGMDEDFQFLCGFETLRIWRGTSRGRRTLSIPLRIRDVAAHLAKGFRPRTIFQFLCGFESTQTTAPQISPTFTFNSFADSRQ